MTINPRVSSVRFVCYLGNNSSKRASEFSAFLRERGRKDLVVSFSRHDRLWSESDIPDHLVSIHPPLTGELLSEVSVKPLLKHVRVHDYYTLARNNPDWKKALLAAIDGKR